MSTAATTAGAVEDRKVEAMDKLLQVWSDRVTVFCNRLYTETTWKDLPAEEQQKLLSDCKFFLRTSNVIAMLARDPDFPPSKYRQQITSAVRRLEEWLAILQNPMTAEEAEQVLQKALPDDPRAGGTS